MALTRYTKPISRDLQSIFRGSFSPRVPLLCFARINNQKRYKHTPNEPRQTPKSGSPKPIIPEHVRKALTDAKDPDAAARIRRELDDLEGRLAEKGFNSDDVIIDYERSTRTVRYLRPAIWALGASVSIFVFLSYLAAKNEKEQSFWARHFERHRPQQIRTQGSLHPSEVLSGYWRTLDPISKTSIGIIVTSGAVHLGSYVTPSLWFNLWHMPIRNVNYTLFTSTFVHSGPFHLLFNMWACYNFMPPTGYSPLFEGNPYHTLSFFLSAGVLSGYAQHLSTMFARTATHGVPEILIRSGGASGALFGIFGAFCMQYPHAGVGIVFLPFSMEAQSFLPCVLAFDLYGMVRGFKTLNLGHAAHLSGALIGVAYSQFDGKEKIWKPLVRFWRRQLDKQSR